MLLESVTIFVKDITMIQRASDSIYETIMVHTVSFLLKTILKCHAKYQILRHHVMTGNGMLCCNERHPLLLECVITFLGYTELFGQASDSIYKLLMVNIVSFLPTTNLNFHTKCQISGTLSDGKYDDVLQEETSIAV